MKILNAISLTSYSNDWRANTQQPHLLHVFEHACNLINERGEILSIVTPHIGNGPFNLVLHDEIRFTDYLKVASAAMVQDTQLCLGDLVISTASARLWQPQPDWNMLHARKKHIFHQLTQLQITNHASLQSPISNSLPSHFSSALTRADVPAAKTFASQFAGLGAGLTPAGDDFIMGALYAAWIMHPPEVVSSLAKEIAETAAPMTTSLSAAWLRSAGKGEAGILWHEFFDALVSANIPAIKASIDNILEIGETSGADALSGFFSTFICDRVNIQNG